MRHVPLLVALAAILAFPACNTGDDELARGEFRAELTGDVETALAGPAAFTSLGGRIPELDNSIVVSLIGSGGRSFLSLSFEGVPEPGTYALDGEGPGSASLIYVSLADDLTLGAESGTVTITRSADDQIEGAFTASLSESLVPGSGSRAGATGAFYAERRDIPTPGR